MTAGRDKDAAEDQGPLAEHEDPFEDIWGQVEGPGDEEEGHSEAFTEFAASPGAYVRGASLRRPPTGAAPAAPLEDEDTSAMELEGKEPAPAEIPGVTGTADDVRSLLDKVMEEALPTNPHAEVPPDPAFPDDSTPTLRPPPGVEAEAAEAPVVPGPAATAVLEHRRVPPPTPPPPPAPPTQLVDPEAAAMEHAVGAAGKRPASFDALPAALSDEVKQAKKVVRGQPAQTLRHLTDDLAMDGAQTSPGAPASAARATSRLAPPPQAAPPPVEPDVPVVEPDLPLELAYDPRKPPRAKAPVDPSRLLDEVSPKSNGKVMIGLAFALIGLLLLLVLKSLL